MRFRIFESMTTDEDPPVTHEDWLPVSVGFIDRGFVEILDFYSYAATTASGSKTLELKEVFVPVRVGWNHYTQDKDTLVTTSTPEYTILDYVAPSYTWPLATPTDIGVTDGEWDGDFVLHEYV